MTKNLKNLTDCVAQKTLGWNDVLEKFPTELSESFGPFLCSKKHKVYNLSQKYSSNIFGFQHPLEFIKPMPHDGSSKTPLYLFHHDEIKLIRGHALKINTIFESESVTKIPSLQYISQIFGCQLSLLERFDSYVIEVMPSLFVSNTPLATRQIEHPIKKYFYEFFVKNNDIQTKFHAFLENETKKLNCPLQLHGRFLFLNLSTAQQTKLLKLGVLGENRQTESYNVYFTFPYCMKPVEIAEAINLIKEIV